MVAQWFINEGVNTYGPFSASQLRKLATEQKITRDTRVKRSTDEKWMRASRIKGLFEPTAERENKQVSVETTSPLMMPLVCFVIMTGISNQQTYSFIAIVNSAMMFLMAQGIVALVYLLSKPGALSGWSEQATVSEQGS